MSGLVNCLLGMGNPLLDIMADVDQTILDKYEVMEICDKLIIFCLFYLLHSR
jgi:hypothetical protein